MSKGLLGKQAEIEVTGLPFGIHSAAKWLPLLGITYEPRDDLMEIALEGVDHLIRGRREIAVEEGPGGVTAMEIVDADQHRQIVRLREPLMIAPR
jgi:hypothetical protein